MSGRTCMPRRSRFALGWRSGSRSRRLFGVAALGVVALLPLAVPLHASAAASGAWTVFPSPTINNTENNALSGVFCNASNDCWAVGFAPTGTLGNQPLIEHYDGTAWTVTVGPSITGLLTGVIGDLTAVTCVTASDCWAVGDQIPGGAGTGRTLAVHWDGTAWAPKTTTNAGTTSTTNLLTGVACTASTNCWAVGYAGSGTGGVDQTLAELWNGTSWLSPAATTNQSTSQTTRLAGVACWNASGCLAVGITGSTSGWVEQFGTMWTTVATPTSAAPTETWLQGVACPASIGCWAAGYTLPSSLQTLVAHYDGTAWNTPSSPNAGSAFASNNLYAVACADVTHCWAVGKYQGSAMNTLAIEYDGTSWTLDSSDNVSGFNNVLQGVACVSTTDCWAVGSDAPSSGVSTSRSLIEHFAPLSAVTPEVPWPALAIAVGLVAAVAVGRRRAGAG